MSSTDKKLNQFFDKYIIPLHEQQKNYLDIQPDKNQTSYYKEYTDSQKLSEYKLDSVGQELARFWENRGNNELVPLCESIQAMAEELHVEEQSADVSPFTYVMF